MRIAMITGDGDDLIMAAQGAHVEGLATALAANGHDIRVYARESGFGDASLAVLRPPQTLAADSNLLSFARAFGGWLAGEWSGRWQPEVVHAHYYTGGLAGLVAVKAAKAPLIATFHSLSPSLRPIVRQSSSAMPEDEVRRRSYERLVGTGANAVVAHSSDEVRDLISLRVPRDSISLVPDAVDDRVFRPDGPAVARDRPRLLSVGPLDGDGAGHVDAIRALAYVPGAELVIIASGQPAKGDSRLEVLASATRETRVGDRVKLAVGAPPAEMPNWYRSASALISGARRGARGKAAIEAMACGVPVVAYDVPVLRDIVVEGVTGELVPAGDPRSLGLAVRRLLAQDFRHMQYGVAAADRARHCFTWPRAIEQTVEVYQRVAG
jgi:D-inositol-3-phosphate glycosyltransferase